MNIDVLLHTVFNKSNEYAKALYGSTNQMEIVFLYELAFMINNTPQIIKIIFHVSIALGNKGTRGL